MKNYILFAVLPLFLFAVACEHVEQEEIPVCLPTNISITLVQGSQTFKIIADFHYLSGTELLDHITWSNHQTHYFEYDDMERIQVIRVMNVDTKVQEERWYVYDGLLVERVDLIKRNLDYTYLEPLDSIYAGYIEYEYEGAYITEEYEYEISADGLREEYVRNVSYVYDDQGNLISSTELDPRSGENTQQTMTYDQTKHPYFALQYYFHGETYVNNMLTRSEGDDYNYTYNLTLNEYEYPETVYEKLGSAYTRIVNYSYEVK
ncbi:MAG: hypothetical protein U9R49_02215 [Bacteroidota bacterium]|nr:hypothetical protein [Bacteroidota bacterium]